MIVIAHRGASGYLPEHTLPSKALAYAQGADYLEQDVVLSRDNIPIVIHDIYLDEVTDVANAYPGRNRPDGRFYAIDFNVSEIKTLRASERFNRRTGTPVFPQRFPLHKARFQLVTLAEELEFIAGLNSQVSISGRPPIGAYVEIKDPAFHTREKRENMSEIVLDVLKTYNYTKRTDLLFLQSFDIEELQRIRNELKSDLKLVGLLTDNRYREEFSETDYTYWTSETGIEDMSGFVDGIGPHYSQLMEQGGTLEPSQLLEYARKYHLFVHPYTFRSDLDPQPFSTFTRLLDFFIGQLKVDGLFIDQPDRAVQYLREKNEQRNAASKLQTLPFLLVMASLAMTQ